MNSLHRIYSSGLILFFISFFVTFSAEAAELSFNQAYKLLQSMNESIWAARSEINRRGHEKSAARGLYYPEVQLGSRYTRIDDPITIDLNSIRGAMLSLHPEISSQVVPPFEKPVQEEGFWRFSANVTWPVFTGGRILVANRAALARLEDANGKLLITQSSLTSELVQNYFGLRLAQKVVEVREQVLDGMNQHLSQAKKLEENGIIASTERLHAEVARAEADRQLKRTIRDAEIAQTALKNILSSDYICDPITPLFLNKNVGSLKDFAQTALSRNPVLKRLAAQQQLAHQGYKKESGTFFPEIYLFGVRELYENDLTLLDPKWAVGIGARFTFFDGFGRSNRVKAAKAMEDQVCFLKQKARRDVETLVEKRYHELLQALEQFETLEASLELAEEYLRVRTRAFEEGMATSLDIVDAQLALSRVKIERLIAAYEFDVSLAKLLEASGQSEHFEEYLSRADVEVEP